VTGSSKRKGDQAELEVQAMWRDQAGVFARRALGAGRKDDVGDIHGIPNTVCQVVSSKHVANAVRNKPIQAEAQRQNARVDHACTFVRLYGGSYAVVMTPEQFFKLWRDAL
jgi:hypothetical protein